jgi:hypothetical protein
LFLKKLGAHFFYAAPRQHQSDRKLLEEMSGAVQRVN